MQVSFFSILLLLVSTVVFAQKQSFVREYTYRASATDSEISARDEALRQMKIELLEEIGVFVSSATNIRNREGGGNISESFFQEVQSNAMGVIETRILDSRWDGRMYWMRAELKADVKQIQNELDEARKKWQAEELRRIQAHREAEQKRDVVSIVAPPAPSDKGHNNYFAWSGLNIGYPFMLGTGFAGRHGGIVGVGYYLSFGIDIGGQSKYRYQHSGGIDGKTIAPVHYSFGIKIFPYKSVSLSAGYGTSGCKQMYVFNDNGERWGTEGWRQGKGLTVLAGYDVLGNMNEGGLFLSIGAGMSYDLFMTEWQPAVSIKLGIAWSLN